jgi:hypothetical protein
MPYKDRDVRLKYLKNYRKSNKEVLNAFDKKRWADDSERRAKHKKHRQENPEKNSQNVRRSLYGISPEEYEAKVRKQGNRCAICRREEQIICKKTGRPYSLSVDHDHKTLKNRDLLCQRCNRALGLFQDSPTILEVAAEYLKRHEEQ